MSNRNHLARKFQKKSSIKKNPVYILINIKIETRLKNNLDHARCIEEQIKRDLLFG